MQTLVDNVKIQNNGDPSTILMNSSVFQYTLNGHSSALNAQMNTKLSKNSKKRSSYLTEIFNKTSL